MFGAASKVQTINIKLECLQYGETARLGGSVRLRVRACILTVIPLWHTRVKYESHLGPLFRYFR